MSRQRWYNTFHHPTLNVVQAAYESESELEEGEEETDDDTIVDITNNKARSNMRDTVIGTKEVVIERGGHGELWEGDVERLRLLINPPNPQPHHHSPSNRVLLPILTFLFLTLTLPIPAGILFAIITKLAPYLNHFYFDLLHYDNGIPTIANTNTIVGDDPKLDFEIYATLFVFLLFLILIAISAVLFDHFYTKFIRMVGTDVMRWVEARWSADPNSTSTVGEGSGGGSSEDLISDQRTVHGTGEDIGENTGEDSDPRPISWSSWIIIELFVLAFRAFELLCYAGLGFLGWFFHGF